MSQSNIQARVILSSPSYFALTHTNICSPQLSLLSSSTLLKHQRVLLWLLKRIPCLSFPLRSWNKIIPDAFLSEFFSPSHRLLRWKMNRFLSSVSSWIEANDLVYSGLIPVYPCCHLLALMWNCTWSVLEERRLSQSVLGVNVLGVKRCCQGTSCSLPELWK